MAKYALNKIRVRSFVHLVTDNETSGIYKLKTHICLAAFTFNGCINVVESISHNAY